MPIFARRCDRFLELLLERLLERRQVQMTVDAAELLTRFDFKYWAESTPAVVSGKR